MVNKHVIIIIDNDEDNMISHWIQNGIKSIEGVKCIVYSIHEINDVTTLLGYDTYVFGSPIYKSHLSSAFRGFMNSIEKSPNLRNKKAAGFVWSSDRDCHFQGPLQHLANFAAEQGLLWISQGDIKRFEAVNALEKENIDRFHSYLGNVSQNTTQLDYETAYYFGKRIGELSK